MQRRSDAILRFLKTSVQSYKRFTIVYYDSRSYCRQFVVVLTYHCEMFIGLPAEIDTANIFVIVIEAFGKYQNFLQEVNVGANLLRGKLIKHLSSNECHCLCINWFLGQESFAVRSCHSSVHSSCWIRIPNTTSTLFYL